MHSMQLSGMDLNLLVALDALLETCSVKQAAKRLALSPSATSHTLARLRELLDDPLLVRSGQRLVATPRGQRLRPIVSVLMHDIERVLRPQPAFDPARLRRTFKVAATDHMTHVLGPPLSQRLARVSPHVDLHCVAMHEDTVEQLRAGGVDLAMAAFPSHPPDIHAEEIFHDRYMCLLRRGHPALTRRLTSRQFAALDHVLIAPRGAPVGRLDHELARHGLKRRIARTVASFHVAPSLVSASDYVVTMTARIALDYVQKLDLVMIEPPIELAPYPLKQVWHRRQDNDPALTWLRAQIRAIGEALPSV